MTTEHWKTARLCCALMYLPTFALAVLRWDAPSVAACVAVYLVFSLAHARVRYRD